MNSASPPVWRSLLFVPVTAQRFVEGAPRRGAAVTVDGKKIDVPVVERARLLLEREYAIAAREARISLLSGYAGAARASSS